MAASLPILTFHALDDRSSAISFAPHVFQRGMARLHEGGYRALSLLEAADGLRHGEPFPDRAFVLTFDDGYQSVYTEAFPVLQHYGWSATVFLTVGQNRKVGVESRLPAMEDRPMLAWREIQEMHRWGLDFGAHTLTHPDLTRLPLAQVETEVCDSQAIIQDALSAAVASFAYPYGRYDRRLRSIPPIAPTSLTFICRICGRKRCSFKLDLTRRPGPLPKRAASRSSNSRRY